MSKQLSHVLDSRSAPLDSTSVRHRRGVIVVLIALLLPMLLAMAAFSVDVTFMQLSRAQLRAATDAAARAGGEALSRLQDVDAARAAAKAGAQANDVAGKPLALADDDIVFGRSVRTAPGGPWVFDAAGTPINSIRVRGRRTSDSPSGAVQLFFGRVLGTPSFEPVKFATVVKLDRDICLVVDRSSSMKIDLGATEEYLEPALYCQPPRPNTRWSALVDAVGAFIDATEDTSAREYVGLVSFSSDHAQCNVQNAASSIERDLSSDTGAITNAIRSLSGTVFNGKTNISAGIDAGVRVLTNGATARPYATKVIVLFTDGKFNEGRHPNEAAAAAYGHEIIIHTVTFGGGANKPDMESVASATGGEAFHATDAAALKEIFRRIGGSMPSVLIE